MTSRVDEYLKEASEYLPTITSPARLLLVC